MDGREVKMRDVAARAGVGMATVSRTLSGGSGVAPTTRQRILDAAAELGYVVSPAASSLAKGSTGRIAVVVPHLSRWICAAMVDGLETRLRPAGYDILIYQLPGPAARRVFFDELPARRKVDAVIVVSMPVTEAERDRLHLMGVQVFAAGGQDVPYPNVTIDDRDVVRQAVDHLALLGHTRIGMVDAIDEGLPDWPQRSVRADAFRDTLIERGLPFEDALLVHTGWGGEAAAEGAAVLLSRPRPPSAIVAHSDEVALGVIRTIRRSGLRVPEDLSVIGIDDGPLAALTDLTTIHQPVDEISRLSAARLLDLLAGQGGDSDTHMIVETHLVPRRTTARFELYRTADAARPD